MSWYVYIIESKIDGIFYKGESATPLKRLNAHNLGLNVSTRSRIPWKLVYLKEFETRTVALKEEKRIKRCNKEYLKWMIEQPGNIAHDSAALSRLA
jgi:putative endonuclease